MIRFKPRNITSRAAVPVLSSLAVAALCLSVYVHADSDDLPEAAKGGSYAPVTSDRTFEEVRTEDIAEKDRYMQRQKDLLERRYDLRDDPSDVMMSGDRKPVQEGVRVKLPDGVDSWQGLASMSPEEIKENDLFPMGFRPLPHPKHTAGGMVFPDKLIETIRNDENRELERFDIAHDLPDHLTPEFPPPLFLTTRPDLGDVTDGQALTQDNFYEILEGKVTPFQMEGFRRLLTPFPQQQFNHTEGRKTPRPSEGVACLDCHTNGHTNAAFELDPDRRPQSVRSRLDTPSLRAVVQQQIHGSRRGIRSLDDFSQVEHATAYFDGDHVIGSKKGLRLPDRIIPSHSMAQAQSIIGLPPAPKLDVTGKLDPDKATEKELTGQEVFFGKGKCAECHQPPLYTDHQMHDLKLGRFYDPAMHNDHYDIADGEIKTFTLRGIKDSPPYLHDGRLLTLEDTVEFFNIVLQTELTEDEKEALVAFLRTL